MKCIAALTIAILALTTVPAVSAPVTFDWAHVGNAGNAADPETGYGAVAYNYAIAKHEVTNAHYTAFLNAVASTDSFGLYNPNMGSTSQGGITRSGSAGSYTYAVKSPAVGQGPGGTEYVYDDKPVVYVSFFDAMRFTNWLHNGQGAGGTETGAYMIGSGGNEVRSADAKYWIPSEDEWYKAAYHDASAGTAGSYFDFPTSTDTLPNNNLPSADTGNSANFFNDGYATNNPSYPMTDVGAYFLSESPYGTFDQGGNVWEWNETVSSSAFRGLRGSSWANISNDLRAGSRFDVSPTNELSFVGFRVATVPEPSAMWTGTLAMVGMLWWRQASAARR